MDMNFPHALAADAEAVPLRALSHDILMALLSIESGRRTMAMGAAKSDEPSHRHGEPDLIGYFAGRPWQTRDDALRRGSFAPAFIQEYQCVEAGVREGEIDVYQAASAKIKCDATKRPVGGSTNATEQLRSR